MKIISKVSQKKAVREMNERAVSCNPHTMCPKCLRGRG